MLLFGLINRIVEPGGNLVFHSLTRRSQSSPPVPVPRLPGTAQSDPFLSSQLGTVAASFDIGSLPASALSSLHAQFEAASPVRFPPILRVELGQELLPSIQYKQTRWGTLHSRGSVLHAREPGSHVSVALS